jgi:hypothetical protein
MQQLAQRLLALDPDAAESIRVVAYFDTLVAGQAAPEALLRGAALLSGCAAGFETATTRMRVGPDGLRAEGSRTAGSGVEWYSVQLDRPGRVWIERDGAPAAADAMIGERLAIALSMTLGRAGLVQTARHPLEVLLDARSSAEERVAAAMRLRLVRESRGRVVARPLEGGSPETSVVVPTVVGFLRAEYLAANERAPERGPAGVGSLAAPGALDTSWRTAVLALRLATTAEPVVAADDLGALLPLLEIGEERAIRHPDVEAVSRLVRSDPSTLGVLEALARTESLRAAAHELDRHPSSVRDRADGLVRSLGYDVRAPEGKARLGLALRLHRLATTRFDGRVSVP